MKKCISLVLTLVFLLASVPFYAVAADAEAELIVNGVVTQTGSLEAIWAAAQNEPKATVNVLKNVSKELGPLNEANFLEMNKGDITLTMEPDVSISVAGDPGYYSVKSAIYVAGGTLTFESGQIKATDARGISCKGNDATVCINGGTISTGGTNTPGVACQSGTLKMTGGTVSSEEYYGIYLVNSARATISGGTVSGSASIPNPTGLYVDSSDCDKTPNLNGEFATITVALQTLDVTVTPSAATCEYGSTMPVLTANVEPEGLTGVTYAWTEDGETISGATGSSYTPAGKGVGTYTYTCTATYDGATGTSAVTVTVSPKTLTPDMVTLTTPEPVYQDDTVTVTVKDGEKTLKENTDYTVSGNTIEKADGNTVTVMGMGNYAGTVTKTVTVADMKPTFEKNGKTYSLDVENNPIFGDITPDPTPVGNGPRVYDDTTIKAMLIEALGEGFSESNVAFYNVTLKVKENGTWTPVTNSADFPAGDIPVTLPKPKGSENASEYAAAHMFSQTKDEHNAGEIETPDVEAKDGGLEFVVNGLSPIAVGWKNAGSGSSGGGGGSGSSPVHQCPSLPYSDLDVALWYHDATDYVISTGRMTGPAPGLFEPYSTLTRAELAQILYNEAGKPPAPAGTFSDVPASAWFAPAVNWAASQGYVQGYGGGRFGPYDPVTREQFAAILWRRSGEPSSSASLSSFTDASTASAYALPALTWAAETGVMQGGGNGLLEPARTVTRVQAAQMLLNCSRVK